MYILVLEYTVYGIDVLLWYRYEVAQLAAQLQIFLGNINIEKCTAANISSVLIWYLCMVSCHTYLWCKYCTHIFNIAARNIEYNCAFFMFRMQQVNKRSEIENNLVNQCSGDAISSENSNYIRSTICITMLHQNTPFFGFLMENWKNVLIELTRHLFWNYIRYTICITMLHLKWNFFDFLLSS